MSNKKHPEYPVIINKKENSFIMAIFGDLQVGCKLARILLYKTNEIRNLLERRFI